jgi:hypothetical protein
MRTEKGWRHQDGKTSKLEWGWESGDGADTACPDTLSPEERTSAQSNPPCRVTGLLKTLHPHIKPHQQREIKGPGWTVNSYLPALGTFTKFYFPIKSSQILGIVHCVRSPSGFESTLETEAALVSRPTGMPWVLQLQTHRVFPTCSTRGTSQLSQHYQTTKAQWKHLVSQKYIYINTLIKTPFEGERVRKY